MRSIHSSVKFFIVQHLGISNKEAMLLITSGKVFVNGLPAPWHQAIHSSDEVTLEGKLIKERVDFLYYAYYKPRGVECTLNTQIPSNLIHALNLDVDVYPVGRLDKDSEGLLLLTNDAEIYDQVINSKHHQEKEYWVEV
ncbi:MAG TPA: pseudouridine synthase, partial [Cytophagales bacterium]|nr:pseudouridine synthase [Cytophagales bacterium]